MKQIIAFGADACRWQSCSRSPSQWPSESLASYLMVRIGQLLRWRIGAHKRPTFRHVVYLLAAMMFIIGGPRGALGQEWRAAAASAVITPTEPLWMAGYASRTRPADGKFNELSAKVLVIQPNAGNPADCQTETSGNPNDDACQDAVAQNAAVPVAVLITLDLIGIDRQLSSTICDRLTQTHGLSREQIAICTSHTHSGPVVGRNLRPMHLEQLNESQQEQIVQYAAFLEETIVRLVSEAMGRLQPCELAWGSGQATFAVNRRNNAEPIVPERRAAGTLAGPFDHDVPVLTVRTAASDEPLAIIFGYACHATVLDGYEWCGDYPGFAQDELQQKYPGATAMFWAGCGGDQNPIPRRQVELAREYGKALAEAVQDVVDGPMQSLPGMLQMQYAEVPLALDTLPSTAKLREDAENPNGYIAARARMLLRQVEQGQPLDETYPYPIARWDLGNQIEFVLLGGETVVDYALRIKADLHGRRTWVAGYSNDVMAYIPSRRVLAEGGYEGGGAMIYYGLPTVWSPDVESTIINEVRRQAKAAR